MALLINTFIANDGNPDDLKKPRFIPPQKAALIIPGSRSVMIRILDWQAADCIAAFHALIPNRLNWIYFFSLLLFLLFLEAEHLP